jgi:hypothetical protein
MEATTPNKENICHIYTSADTIRQQEQDNMLPHVSTSRNSLYTDILHPHYLTQRILFYSHRVEQIYRQTHAHTGPVSNTQG